MKPQMFSASTLGCLMLLTVAHAEISGSGRPNANCASAQIGGRLFLEESPTAAGLPGVVLNLEFNDQQLTAHTDADGVYLFYGLCDGDHELSIDFDSLPDGVTLSSVSLGGGDDDSIHESDDDSSDDGSDDDGSSRDLSAAWEIELDDDDESRLDVNFGFTGTPAARCTLSLETGCAVPSLATELYVCSKPVNELSMVWNGTIPIRVIAHNGKRDDDILADLDTVMPGQRVTVGNMNDAPDDVVWEIFAAGTDIKLGESRFHLGCDDRDMDGPEDCGVAQGNGKDDKSDRINDWSLHGLRDASGQIDCTAVTYADFCEFRPVRADCDLVDEVFALTFAYTGARCSDSVHGQPDKFECDGDVDGSLPVTIELEDDTRFTVRPGETFSIPGDGSDTKLELTNSGGKQELKIHTSCSKPLAAGDSYGALALRAINGLGVGTPVDFSHNVVNSGDAPAGTVTIIETAPTLFDDSETLGAHSSVTLYGSRWVDSTLTNTAVATGTTSSGSCTAADAATAVVHPIDPCEVVELERELHDEEIRWRLSADPSSNATIERVEISWPVAIAGKLKEMKFDGDKFFDRDTYSGALTVSGDDLEGELKKRRIKRGKNRELKIKFDDDIESTGGDYAVTVHFAEGCSISW